MSSEDPMRSYLLLDLVAQTPKYACFFDTEVPLRLKLGSEILIVYLLINSSMNLQKHPIVKVIQLVVNLLVQLIALGVNEINSLCPCISEIPFHQQFFVLGVTKLSFIP